MYTCVSRFVEAQVENRKNEKVMMLSVFAVADDADDVGMVDDKKKVTMMKLMAMMMLMMMVL